MVHPKLQHFGLTTANLAPALAALHDNSAAFKWGTVAI
jgi:hypothetical protein